MNNDEIRDQMGRESSPDTQAAKTSVGSEVEGRSSAVTDIEMGEASGPDTRRCESRGS
jgi:hypothetical protein